MEPMLPPQPPPDVPEPPPGPEAQGSRIKAQSIWGCGLICASPFLLGLALFPIVDRQRKSADRIEAINNIKQIHLALIDFDREHGTFPDASTISAVHASTGTTLSLGRSSSNELFRQLIATGTKSEKIFWAKTATTPYLPNDVLGPDALRKGECSFTYIAGLSSSSDPIAPIAMAPVIRGTLRFDPKPFKGKAVMLRVDGSAKAETIDEHGHVMIGGMNLFDSRQPYWRGKSPDIKWQE